MQIQLFRIFISEKYNCILVKNKLFHKCMLLLNQETNFLIQEYTLLLICEIFRDNY